MNVPAALRAREPRAAAHTAVTVLAVCAVVLGLFTAFGPAVGSATVRPVAWVSVVGMALVAILFARVPAERLDRAGAFLVLGVCAVAALSALVVATRTSTTATQAFLAFAVLYAGFHLRQLAVAVVTVAAVAADAVMLLLLQPPDEAVTNLVFFGAMLTVMGALLARSGNNQERMVQALEHQAGVDALTGLVTRRVLDDALAGALSKAEVQDGSALVLMDVDGFKGINDSHGHPVGDDALVHLAAVFTSQVRGRDAVVSRLGGDEIAVLLPGCSAEAAARRAQDLLQAVRAAPLTLPDGTLLALSVSIGVAHAPRHATDLRALYAAADAALYEAKRGGRGRVAVCGAPA